MNTKAVKPDDILGDAENFAELNGVAVRKGSIAAFLKNIDLFEDPKSGESEKAAALEMMQQLSPAVIASRLYKHATFKNPIVQDILDGAAQE